jgi:hypothetical protein
MERKIFQIYGKRRIPIINFLNSTQEEAREGKRRAFELALRQFFDGIPPCGLETGPAELSMLPFLRPK